MTNFKFDKIFRESDEYKYLKNAFRDLGVHESLIEVAIMTYKTEPDFHKKIKEYDRQNGGSKPKIDKTDVLYTMEVVPVVNELAA